MLVPEEAVVIVVPSSGAVGVLERPEAEEDELLFLVAPAWAFWAQPAISTSYGGGRLRLRGVSAPPMLTGEGHAEWLRARPLWWVTPEEEDL